MRGRSRKGAGPRKGFILPSATEEKTLHLLLEKKRKETSNGLE